MDRNTISKIENYIRKSLGSKNIKVEGPHAYSQTIW